MKNWSKRVLSLLLAGMMLLSLAACGGGSDNDTTDGESADGSDSTGATYTYRRTMSDVSTWSPTDHEGAEEFEILEYVTTSFYSAELNETKDNYEFIPSAASDFPEDVTAEYAGNPTYGVPADATEGYAYKIPLREGLTWEDGTPITADDYVYSIEQYLNPEMKNYRASLYYEGSMALANAKAYYDGTEATYNRVADLGLSMADLTVGADGAYTDADGNPVYFGWGVVDSYLYDSSMKDAYSDYYTDEGIALFDANVNEDGYVPLTDEVLSQVNPVVVDSWGDSDASSYCFIFRTAGKTVYNRVADQGMSMADLTVGADGVYADPDGNPVYFGWGVVDSYLYDSSMKDAYSDYYTDEAIALFDANVNADGYVPLTDEVLSQVNPVVVDSWGDSDASSYCFTYGQSDPVTFEDVGIIKNDDYSITEILTKPLDITDFCNECYILCVKKDLYEANKKETGGVIKSSYGTAADKFSSYGPYRIVSYQADKQMVLTRNENWYGWTDDYYKDKYMTTDIDIQVVEDKSTRFNLFLQGKLSHYTLTADQITEYANSDYLYYTPDTYVYSIFINTDVDTLSSRNTPGVNHSILSVLDFRKAISLCMDRQDFSQYMAGYQPCYGLLDDVYMCTLSDGRSYRATDEAKQALCDFYGVDDTSEITGYDVEQARTLFQSAYDQAVAEGLMQEGDSVQIDIHTYSSDTGEQTRINFFQSSINTACEGTSLEGKITLNRVVDENFSSNMRQGLCDMIFYGWGGADTDPYWMMICYCTPDYNYSWGYDPNVETMTINVDGEDITMTAYDWYMALHETTYVSASIDERNEILASMEEQILSYYAAIPMSAMTTATLYSQRIVRGSDTYVNCLVKYGGLSQMTYTMNDAEWDAYCAENNYKLTY